MIFLRLSRAKLGDDEKEEKYDMGRHG